MLKGWPYPPVLLREAFTVRYQTKAFKYEDDIQNQDYCEVWIPVEKNKAHPPQKMFLQNRRTPMA